MDKNTPRQHASGALAPIMEIIPAAPEHVPEIHDMIEALADHLGLSHELVATEEHLYEALFGDHQQAEVILAHEGEHIAGFALFYNNYSTFRGRCGMHLEDLYVKPAWRGRGIGKRLLAHLSKMTLERGCNRLEWWVLGEDVKAVEFYENLKASAKDEWNIYRLKGKPLSALAGI